MSRLPTPGGDDGNWGSILNDFLQKSHNADGTLTSSSIQQAGGIVSSQVGAANGVAGLDGATHVPRAQLGSGTADGTTYLRGDGTWSTPAGGGTGSLATDSDVALASPADNQVLAYNAGTSKWTNVALPRLDQVALPTASVSLNSQKITGISDGTAPSDAAAFGQIPTSSPPNGAAGGDLSGTYPNPAVAKIKGIALPASAPSGSGQVLTSTGTTTTAWQTPASGSSNAWQFKPESYGAVGDGQVVGDVSVNSGSAVIISASGKFVSGDVGKYIMINGGLDAAGGPLITTIASYQSATQVTLATAATNTSTNCAAAWGTDDTAAINSAVAAAKTYALANDYFAEIIFKDKVYVLAAGPTQSVSPTYNAQIPIPYPDLSGSRKLVIAFTGVGSNDHLQYWNSNTPNVAGTCLFSMATAPNTIDATYGPQSVLGGPTGNGGFTGGGGGIPAFPNIKAVFTNLMVMCGAYTNQTAFDVSWCGGTHIDGCSAHVFAPPGYNGGSSPLLKDMISQSFFQSRTGVGLRSPVIGDNADTTVPSFVAEGYHIGVYASDHFAGGRIGVLYSDVALYIDNTQGLSGVCHAITIPQFTAEVYNGGIRVNGGYAHVYIVLDSECGGPAYDLSDVGNNIYGQIFWSDPADSREPVVDGGSNVKFINTKRGPGVWTGAPAVPASGVAQQNTAWRDATIYLSATSGITGVSVDSTAVGLTAGNGVVVPIQVPSGHSYTVTYSGTLSANWFLL